MGLNYNSLIVCMCIIMRLSRNRSASWAEKFWTSSLLYLYILVMRLLLWPGLMVMSITGVLLYYAKLFTLFNVL